MNGFIPGRKVVGLFFLSTNSEVVAQPIDATVIRRIKRMYLKRLVLQRVTTFVNYRPFGIPLFDAMHMLRYSSGFSQAGS